MALAISLTSPMVIPAVIGCTIVVLVILVALLFRKYQKKRSRDAKRQRQSAPRLAYQPEPRTVPVLPGTAIPRPRKKPTVSKPPARNEISLTKGRADITDSMNALVEKYRLDQFTIATDDGLVFAAGGSGDAASDAAQFGGATDEEVQAGANNKPALAKATHRGSRLILIIRSPAPLTDRERTGIVEDTKVILNWWI